MRETEGEKERERERDGEACVAVVTGTLHRNDFNRSSDTDTCTQILTYREGG